MKALALGEVMDGDEEGSGHGERGPTLMEIGQTLGMGPSGVKFIEAGALRKLKGSLREKGEQMDLGLGLGGAALDAEMGIRAAILRLAVREMDSAEEEVKELIEGARNKLWMALEELLREKAGPEVGVFELLRSLRDVLVGRGSPGGRRALRLVSGAMTDIVTADVKARAGARAEVRVVGVGGEAEGGP